MSDQHTDEGNRALPYCPDCGKGIGGRDTCPYCKTELVEDE